MIFGIDLNKIEIELNDKTSLIAWVFDSLITIQKIILSPFFHGLIEIFLCFATAVNAFWCFVAAKNVERDYSLGLSSSYFYLIRW